MVCLKELEKELNALNIKLENNDKEIIQYKSNITEEQMKTKDMNKKNEKLETEIDLLKTEILELTKARTLKIPSYPTIAEESDEKLIIQNKDNEGQVSDKNNKFK